MCFLRRPRSLEVRVLEHRKQSNTIFARCVVGNGQILYLDIVGWIGDHCNPEALPCIFGACKQFDCLFLLNFTPWIQTGGFGVFAGRDVRKDDLVMWSWRTLFLPKTLPHSSPWYYSFGHNETHMSVPLSYGSLANNHENANILYASTETDATKTGFVVRGGFNARIATF